MGVVIKVLEKQYSRCVNLFFEKDVLLWCVFMFFDWGLKFIDLFGVCCTVLVCYCYWRFRSWVSVWCLKVIKFWYKSKTFFMFNFDRGKYFWFINKRKVLLYFTKEHSVYSILSKTAKFTIYRFDSNAHVWYTEGSEMEDGIGTCN